jgi:glycosyltransferase involved in cell wall biosynthesis
MDMKYNTARIAILVPRQSFVHRGVGVYCKSIIDFALRQCINVDIISDDHARDNGLLDAYQGRVSWFTPRQRYDDKVFKELSTFGKPYDVGTVLNLRNSLIEALRHHSYDLVITNTGEALDAVTGLGLNMVSKVAHATHHESEAHVTIRHDIFTKGVSTRYSYLCGLPDVTLLCQSAWVKSRVVSAWPDKLEDAVVATPLLAEPQLLEFEKLPSASWGVGFVGPYEPRKEPDEFIRVVSKAKLPAVIITPSETSAKKFREKLTEAGVEHRIHVGITGQAKVEVLRGLAAGYHPAQSETFGLGAFETSHTCPTLLLDSRDWSGVHEKYSILCSKETVVDTLKAVYGKRDLVQQDTLRRITESSESVWKSLMHAEKTTKQTKNNFFTELDQQGLVKHSEFVEKARSFCVDEVHKMMRLPNTQDIEALHTVHETYYRRRGSQLEPKEDDKASVLSNLFDLE